MKAFVVTHYGPDVLEVDDVPTPKAGPRDVLVDVRSQHQPARQDGPQR